MSEFLFEGKFVWQPRPEDVIDCHMQRFMNAHGISSLDELLARSTTDIVWFTDAILKYLDIQFYEPYTRVMDLSRGKAWPQWCLDSRMNIVHNCLDKWLTTPKRHQVAIRWEGESGETRTLTYQDLTAEVNRAANALRELGLSPGDAIGLYMPMTPEIVIALLAIAKIGGIILPLFSGYGSQAISTRLADADAKAVFVADGVVRRGKTLPMKRTLDEALTDAKSVEHVIVHRYTGIEIPWNQASDHWWHDIVARQAPLASTEVTSAEDTVMIIYTSGTTGRPKGAVHTHCGFPIKAAQDMALCMDIQAGDTLYWMTDMGWMMGPWQVFGVLLLGASMMLYDGAPDYPDIDRIWSLVADHGITLLGLSPTLIRALMVHGEEPVQRHDLSRLRAFGSTGEPWNPGPWHWLFEVVGRRRCPIINYSGGTEISGGIIAGNVMTPLKPTAFAGPVPGIAADVVDDWGHPVRESVGELVIRQPWIGMTRGFWRDHERYEQTYWRQIPGMWVHGDFAAIDRDGQWYILGRSDDTIKIAGKRLGPAEVESILVQHDLVLEAGSVGIPHPVKGSSLLCFVVLAPNAEATADLAEALKDLVSKAMGKALRPQEIVFVTDLPKTRNAKVMRRVLRAAYLGQETGDLSALVNPEIVHEIRDLGSKRTS